MSWDLAATWPIDDPELSFAELVGLGEVDLPAVAREADARLVGEPAWEIVECDPDQWPGTETVLTVKAPAVPLNPMPREFPDIVRFLALTHRWTDRKIGVVINRSARTVRDIRQRHQIDPGVPRGYTDITKVSDPRQPAESGPAVHRSITAGPTPNEQAA